MKFILNIGLDVKATRTLSAEVALQMVAVNDFIIGGHTIIQSDTEPTLVVEVTSMSSNPRLVLQQLHAIAVDLQQDCIGAYRTLLGKGALVGPNTAAWGEFNPEYFFLLNGLRLRPVKAAA